MKVLALLTDGFGAPGGIARYNCDFVTALAGSTGVEHITVLPRFGDSAAPLPARTSQLAPKASRIIWSCKAVQLALWGGYDLIFCGHLFALPLAAALSGLTRAPLWLQLHGVESWKRPGYLIRRAVGQARLTTAVSRATRERALSWWRAEPERLRILPNTVDGRFSPGPPTDAARQRFGTAGRRVILTVSRLAASERYKGHDRIIAALPRIYARCPQVLYLVVGQGDDRPRLEELARQTGVSELVRFAGAVKQDELVDVYRLADVFAMPSTGEGFGIVFLEAAATGIPVVAGNVDGSVDALADGELGTLVAPDDSRALADAIVEGMEQNRARESLASRFGFPSFAQQVNHLVASRF